MKLTISILGALALAFGGPAQCTTTTTIFTGKDFGTYYYDVEQRQA
ncbi:hypothetical protein ARSEF4850_000250 [Beauveria asiatica]